jgi:hypothetical protein
MLAPFDVRRDYHGLLTTRWGMCRLARQESVCILRNIGCGGEFIQHFFENGRGHLHQMNRSLTMMHLIDRALSLFPNTPIKITDNCSTSITPDNVMATLTKAQKKAAARKAAELRAARKRKRDATGDDVDETVEENDIGRKIKPLSLFQRVGMRTMMMLAAMRNLVKVRIRTWM